MFINWFIPGRQLWDENGTSEEVQVKGGFYPTLGLEGTVFFGDFKPPKKGKNRRKKKGGRR